MYSRCIIDVFSPIDLDFYLFACLFLCLFVFESSKFTLHSNKIDMVVFFFKWAWQGNKLGHFCQGALIIDGNLGPLWAVFAAFGCFGPFWAVLILKVFLPTITHSLVTGPL